MTAFLVPALALLVAAPLHAAPDEAVVQQMARQTRLPAQEIRSNYKACDSGVTLTMKICAGYRWTVEDVRLNKVYQQILADTKDPDIKASLVRAQRAWLSYRDAACQYEGAAQAAGGTAEGLFVLSCKEELTKQRADRLHAVHLE